MSREPRPGESAWTPIRLETPGPVVDWCWTRGISFDDPFFTQTVERALREPFRLLFRRRTPLDALYDVPERVPDGLVLHASRCGSTLVAQLLGRIEGSRVLSEPGPIEDALRLRGSMAARAALLRALASALGADRPGTPYVLKLDAWALLDLDVLRLAFPEVPWVFCYRHPAAILASQRRQRGYHMVPGTLTPERLGLAGERLGSLSLEQYGAVVLGRLLECAEHGLRGDAKGLAIHYDELPAAVWDRIVPHFGLQATADEVLAMQRASRFDAKNPSLTYATSGPEPRELRPVDHAEHALAAYQALESRRTGDRVLP